MAFYTVESVHIWRNLSELVFATGTTVSVSHFPTSLLSISDSKTWQEDFKKLGVQPIGDTLLVAWRSYCHVHQSIGVCVCVIFDKSGGMKVDHIKCLHHSLHFFLVGVCSYLTCQEVYWNGCSWGKDPSECEAVWVAQNLFETMAMAWPSGGGRCFYIVSWCFLSLKTHWILIIEDLTI